MRFIRTYVREGIYEREINWDDINLVFSNKNTCGKTTLLRILLYSLGYSIPNTKKFPFEKCLIETDLITEEGRVHIKREGDYLEYVLNGEINTYILPQNQEELHKKIWNCENIDIVNNILGAIYVDQEKGWTLLNRGKAIGNIRFNIEELVRGLSDRECDDLINRKKKIESELKRFKQIFNIAKYKEEIDDLKGELISDSYENELEQDIEILRFEYSNYKKELKRIENVIKKNNSFKKYIEDMKLYVVSSNGEEIPVNKNTIIGMKENNSYLLAKKKIILSEMTIIQSKIEKLTLKISDYDEQISFGNSETLLQKFDKDIINFNIDSVAVQRIITRLEKERKQLNELITHKTKIDNKVVDEMYNTIMKYAKELGLNITDQVKYLFTNNLKELSGAVLHKLVFIFRIAAILEIEKKLNMKVPIIIDSPSGREVDKENVDAMIDILKRDFKDNQIIIASIYKYNFERVNIIEIKDNLVTDLVEKFDRE